MKVYKFYLSQDDETVRRAIETGNNIRDVHPLYAYTNSKEMRDEFVEMHNMKCFLRSRLENVEIRMGGVCK